MKALWTFENQAKLDSFTAILREHEIAYETTVKDPKSKNNTDITVSIDEREYAQAKRLLLKHRKRRIGSDYT